MQRASNGAVATATAIKTPDQRLRVFISSTLGELAEERGAVKRAIERLRLAPVMFEEGARPHPPAELYRAYLEQSHLFIGVYWESYGWVAPGEEVSGIEDEYLRSGNLPKLIYVKSPAPPPRRAAGGTRQSHRPAGHLLQEVLRCRGVGAPGRRRPRAVADGELRGIDLAGR